MYSRQETLNTKTLKYRKFEMLYLPKIVKPFYLFGLIVEKDYAITDKNQSFYTNCYE